MTKKTRRILLITGLLAVAAVIMLVTCPDSDAHREAVSDEISDVAMESISSSSFSTFAPVAGLLMPSITESLVATQLRVKNLFLCSIGYVNYGGDRKMVSLGVFGHVFVFGRDEIKQAIMGVSDNFFDSANRYNILESSEGKHLDEEGNVVD